MKLPLSLCTIFAAILTSAQAPYQIDFKRSLKAGDSYRLTASGDKSESMKMSVQGQVIQQMAKKLEVSFVGIYTINEVGTNGSVDAFTLKVESFTGKNAEGATQVASQGDLIVVKRGGSNGAVTINGNPAPPAQAELIGILFKAPESDVSDDQIFGTKEKKNVGDVWQADLELASKSFAQMGMSFDAATSKVQTKLAKVAKVNGFDSLILENEMKLSGITLPLPPGMKVESAVMTGKNTGAFPVNSRLEQLGGTSTMSMTAKATGQPNPEGPVMTLEISGTQNKKASQTPIRK